MNYWQRVTQKKLYPKIVEEQLILISIDIIWGANLTNMQLIQNTTRMSDFCCVLLIFTVICIVCSTEK